MLVALYFLATLEYEGEMEQVCHEEEEVTKSISGWRGGRHSGGSGEFEVSPGILFRFFQPGQRVTCHLTWKSDAAAAISFEFCGYARHYREERFLGESERVSLGFRGLCVCIMFIFTFSGVRSKI